MAATLWVTFDGYRALRQAANPDATAVVPSVVALTPADGVTPEELAASINDQVDGVEALTRGQAVEQAPGVSLGLDVVPADPRRWPSSSWPW